MNVPFKNSTRETPNPPVSVTPVFDATDLLGEGITAKITLDDQVYTLRRTRQNKLILNK